MPRKWQKLMNMRKLTTKQLDRAKKLICEWERIKEVAQSYWVTYWYFYYYWIRKKT